MQATRLDLPSFQSQWKHCRSFWTLAVHRSIELCPLSVKLISHEMSDSTKPKANTIPSWQRAEIIEAEKQGESVNHLPESRSHPKGSEHDLSKQALKFLDHDEIREASTERKIEFLEKKGLASDEIRRLLIGSLERDTKEAGPTDEAGEGPSVRGSCNQLQSFF